MAGLGRPWARSRPAPRDRPAAPGRAASARACSAGSRRSSSRACGLGCGMASNCRASARRCALAAGASSPKWRMRLKPGAARAAAAGRRTRSPAWRWCACRRRRRRVRRMRPCRRRWPADARCRWPCGGCSATGSPAPQPARPAPSWRRPPSRAGAVACMRRVRSALSAPDRASAPACCACCNASRNLPLNDLGQGVHREQEALGARGRRQPAPPSACSAPQAISACTCRCRRRSCVQVCSTSVKRRCRPASARWRRTR
jgi:hypothetical protein